MLHFHHPPSLRAAAAAVRHCSRSSKSIDVLSLCSTAQSLSATKKAHAVAITHGRLPSSLSISAALILSYASHNSHPSIPQFLFNQTSVHARSPFLHNTFVRACTLLAAGPHSKSAINLGISLYNDLLSNSRFFPDDHTFPFVLKLCADHLNLPKGREVHGRLIKAGFDTDVSSVTP